MRVKKIGSVGDVNPMEYGGGFIFSAKGVGGPWIEWFDGLDVLVDEIGQASADDIPDFEVAVYRVSLEKDAKDFLSQYDWVDWGDVASSTGQNVKVYTTPSQLKSVQARAMALLDAAGYYGWHEFDQYRLIITIAELEKRWGL